MAVMDVKKGPSRAPFINLNCQSNRPVTYLGLKTVGGIQPSTR